jgi:hypothetical protein
MGGEGAHGNWRCGARGLDAGLLTDFDRKRRTERGVARSFAGWFPLTFWERGGERTVQKTSDMLESLT